MRKIKYRAKDTISKKWVYSNGYYHDGINYWFMIPNDINKAIGFAEKVIINAETLGQFTGKVDMDINEIYEGDIIEGECCDYGCKHTRLVEWDNDFSCFDPLGEFCCSMPCCDSTRLDKTTIKIVGNKYDNPNMKYMSFE